MSAEVRDYYNTSKGQQEFYGMAQLKKECITGSELNHGCFYENFTEQILEQYFDDYLGDDNLFEIVLKDKDVNSIRNFQIETFTMSLIRTDVMICKNISKFREDFKVQHLYRIENEGLEKCYVILSRLKPYWITASLNNFLNGYLKLKLFDKVRAMKEPERRFLWVRLKL